MMSSFYYRSFHQQQAKNKQSWDKHLQFYSPYYCFFNHFSEAACRTPLFFQTRELLLVRSVFGRNIARCSAKLFRHPFSASHCFTPQVHHLLNQISETPVGFDLTPIAPLSLLASSFLHHRQTIFRVRRTNTTYFRYNEAAHTATIFFFPPSSWCCELSQKSFSFPKQWNSMMLSHR